MNARIRLVLWAVLLLIGLVTTLLPDWRAVAQQPVIKQDRAPAGSDPVYQLTLDDDIISPVTLEYIRGGIEAAHEANAGAVLIRMDTPGGLLSSTHAIVKEILNSPVPIIVYVAPAGARAGSAGVFITLAADVAAMAPSTRIGAAHPVTAGGTWPGTRSPAPEGEDGAPVPSVEDVMSEKILNDTVAAIRAIARSRGRNEGWAVKAVTESVSITADEALANNVVDFIAPDVESLLDKLDGFTYRFNETEKTLSLTNPQIEAYEFSVRQQIISILTHPMLSYMLLMIGFYGILFEVTHPGLGFAGFTGIVCVLLALVGMQALSINYAGLFLIALGLALFTIEIFTPTFGILAAGGVVSLVTGTLLLYKTGEPFLLQIIPYVVGVAVVLGGLTVFMLYKVLKTYKRHSTGPHEKVIGQVGRVVVPIEPGGRGKVHVFGEIWDATANEGLAKDARIHVTACHPDQRLLVVGPYDGNTDVNIIQSEETIS